MYKIEKHCLPRLLGSLIFLQCAALFVSAQDITTASRFFDSLEDRYSSIQDYSATIDILENSTTMSGQVSYKRPNKLRIDFTKPAKQVICSDGTVLKIYVPGYDVTLLQALDSGGSSGNMATAEGLALMRRGFNIAYVSGPGLTNLDENSNEQVYKLLLTWKNTNQGFRELRLSITPSYFIRRIEGVTSDRKTIRITYSNLEINQGIPDSRFDYESPATSNAYDNFLFGN